MADEEFFDPNLPPSPFGILWHAPGEKFYSNGVDRGVLYLEGEPGVPWNGLVSVDEKPEGGGIVPFYMDGVRRRNDHHLEEFAATITALSAPAEFAVCEGEVELAPGLFLGQQVRESFGFSYRTHIGNDIGGREANYQLHLVYECLVEPSPKTHSSITSTPDAQERSWDFATLPIDVMQHNPSARIRLDSRYVDPVKMEAIQNILYGSIEPARLPLIDEVYNILIFEEVVVDEEEIPWIPTDPEEDSGTTV